MEIREYKAILIDYNNIIELNNLINIKQRIPPLSDIYTQNSSNYIGLILIIESLQIQNLENLPHGIDRVEYINSLSFVNSIKDYMYLIYDQKKSLCEIIDFKKEFAVEILESVLTSLPHDVIVLVNINLRDKNWIKLTKVYTDIGFNNPYISKGSLLGFSFNEYHLYLLKENNPHTTRNAFNDVLYVVDQFNNRKTQNCAIQIKLSKKTCNYFKQLAKSGATLNKNGSISQKETAGSLDIHSVDNNLVYSLDVNKNSIILGDEETVPIINSRYNFHSHPKEAYERHKVKMGWPSSQDFLGYLGSIMQFRTILHIVVCIEGVYIISLGNFWVDKFDQLDDKVISFIKKNYDDAYMSKKIKEYIKKVNNIKYKDHPLFLIQYLDWDNIENTFSIFYPKEDLNCFIE